MNTFSRIANCWKSSTRRRHPVRSCLPAALECLEQRQLLSAAFDVVGLTELRVDATYADVDGSNIGVAVIDSGLYAVHPDLQGNFVAWYDAVSNGDQARQHPGSSNPQTAFDPDGHGTHVAGTVASTNPEIGVAPAADLIGIRGLPADNERAPQWNSVIAGLNWVEANHEQFNIRVVNMSLGTYSNSNEIPADNVYSWAIDRLEQLGITVVTASGNHYAGFASPGVSSPAVFSTLSVANTWEDNGQGDRLPDERVDGSDRWVSSHANPEADQLAAGSQRSSLPNQVAAPGTTIYSTWNNENGLLYNTIMGTSMASPMVAGMVALMQDAADTFGGRYLTPDEITRIVRETADEIVDHQLPGTQRFPVQRNAQGELVRTGPNQDLRESELTLKRVNIYRAVQYVRDFVTQGGTPDPEPTPDPGQRTADTNNTIGSAIVLPPLDATREFPFNGIVGLDGQVEVGPNDADVYQMTLESPGRVRLELAPVAGGVNFDAMVRLFDSAGRQLAAADDTNGSHYPTLEFGPLPAGTYYFGVSSYNNVGYDVVNGAGSVDGQSVGHFQGRIGLSNPDPNGVVQGAADLDLTAPNVLSPATGLPANYVFGLVDSDPNPIDPDGSRVQIGPTDVDMFRIVAPDTGVLTIDINAQSVYGTDAVDSFVRVFGDDLQQLAANDDEDLGLFDSYLQVPVQEGRVYYIAVTTFGNRDFSPTDPFDRLSETNEIGLFDMYLSFDNGDVNGTLFEAVDYALFQTNGVVPGTIGSDFGTPLLSANHNGGAKDVDFLVYTTPSSGLLEISAVSPDDSLSPVLGLWQYDSEAGDVLQIADTAGSEPRIIREVQAGEFFYISATGAGNSGFNWFATGSGSGGDTGNYELTASMRGQSELRVLSNNSIDLNTPDDITVDNLFTRNIGRDGSVVEGADDIDMYKFVPQTTGLVEIWTNTSTEGSANTFLRVFNDNYQELVHNDNASERTSASLVTLHVTAGRTYYIGVNGASADARDYDPRTGSEAADGSQGDYVIGITALSSTLERPQLVGPSASASSTTPTFRWSTVEGAHHYDLWANDLTTGQSGVIRNQNVAGARFTPGAALPDGHRFIWTVRAIAADGTEGDWGTHQVFTVNAGLGTPSLTGPSGTVAGGDHTFEWSAVSGAQRYDLWVNDLTTGQSGVIRNQNVATNSFHPDSLLVSGHRYIWTVRAIAADGTAGEWAAHQTFTLTDGLSTASLIGPTGTVPGGDQTFQWSAVSGAQRYDLWVNDLTTGQSGVIRNQNVAMNSFQPGTPLATGHRYIWTVRAIAADGTIGAWAGHRTFTVGDGLQTPTLLGPAGTVGASTPRFEWSAASGAHHYDLWVNNRTTGQSGVIRVNVDGTSFTAGQLTPGHSYIWTVRAVAADGTASAWGVHRTFTVSATASNSSQSIDLAANEESFLPVAGASDENFQRINDVFSNWEPLVG